MEGGSAQPLGLPALLHNCFSHFLLPPATCSEEVSEGLGFHPSGVGLGADSFLGQHPPQEAGDQREVNKTLAFV